MVAETRLKINKSFRFPIIRNRLKNRLTLRARILLTIVEYLFSSDIQEMITELDGKFNKPRGPRAYPRTLIIGVIMFCLYIGIEFKTHGRLL